MSLNQRVAHHLSGEVEKSCACELNYILAPIYSQKKKKLNWKKKKSKTDMMWEGNVKLTGSITGLQEEGNHFL